MGARYPIQLSLPNRLSFFQHTQKRRSMSGVLDEFGAGNETRTRDPDLGKVVLYQLSYSRKVTLGMYQLSY